jgi:hypothetical protein
MFPMHNKKFHKHNKGNLLITSFNNRILRVDQRSYNINNRQNNPEEHNPWPNIIKNLPIKPIHLINTIPTKTGPI